jgi:GT2 family glycosyltransferase
MQISVITVSTNSKEHIRNCLTSLRQQTHDVEYEVIVVDNASTDGTPEMVKTEFPWVKLVENPRNLGFGTANNRGAAIATGEILCFYNDDTIQTQNTLKAVYDKMRSDHTLGVLGFHLTFTDGKHQDSIRRYPTWRDQAVILTKLHNFFPNVPSIRRYLAQDIDYTKEQEVDQLMGACMVIRADVFRAVKGFDEEFFVWFEEIDLEKRIKEQLGLRIVYWPGAEMVHVKGATFGKAMSVQAQEWFNDSMRHYFRKHHGVFQAWFLSALQPLSLLLSAFIQWTRNRGVDVKKMKHGQN